MRHVFISAALMAGFTLPASAQSDFSTVEIRTQKLAEGVYMLEGAGGNIGLSVGKDGAFLIDDQFAPLNSKITAAIAAVSDQPVEFVLNTHHHGDHTGGNEPFGASGAYIVAHDNVRKHLSSAENPAPEDSLPVITFSETTTFFWNGQEIFVFHPESAHTDGDAIVHFRNENIVHMGDTFFAQKYPYIDLENGGSLSGYINALETAVALMDEHTKVIPGHGGLSSRSDITDMIAMLQVVRERVQALIDRGYDEDAVAAAEPLKDLDGQWSWDFINGEKMTRAAFQSLGSQ